MAANTLKTIQELDLLMDKNTKKLSEAITKIGMAFAQERLSGRRNQDALIESKMELGQIFKSSQGTADLLGRKRILLEMGDFGEEQIFAETVSPENFSLDRVFALPFKEAAQSIIEGRVFGKLSEQDRANISGDVESVYGDQVPVLNFEGVGDAVDDIFEKVNRVLVEDISVGLPREEAIEKIKDALQDWSVGKGNRVYRTQIAKAYTAGRWRQLETPEIRNSVGGVQFLAVDDSNVRKDHFAFHRMIFSPRDSIWSFISGPIHYNCRCTIRILTFRQMLEMNRLDETQANNAFPLGTPIYDTDIPKLPFPRFEARPDKTVYGF